MCQWIESIRIENGEIKNMYWHQKRVDETFQHFATNITPFKIESIIRDISIPVIGIYKLRIIYNIKEVNLIEIVPYLNNHIEEFNLVEQNYINYEYKFAQRSMLDILKVNQYKEPIIVQNNLITDTRYSNLIFLKNNEWYTPTSFLLNGTMRQMLLKHKFIKEAVIDISNFKSFSHFKLINAMLPPERTSTYSIDCIIT